MGPAYEPALRLFRAGDMPTLIKTSSVLMSNPGMAWLVIARWMLRDPPHARNCADWHMPGLPGSPDSASWRSIHAFIDMECYTRRFIVDG